MCMCLLKMVKTRVHEGRPNIHRWRVCLEPNTIQDIWHSSQNTKFGNLDKFHFTCESRFTLSTYNRCDRFWRCHCECSEACNILQHHRFGSGSVMVWGDISLVCQTAHMCSPEVVIRIPRLLLRPYAGAVGPEFLLMQDNASLHVAGMCQQFLHDKAIDAMDWPEPKQAHPVFLHPPMTHCTPDWPGVERCFSRGVWEEVP